MLDYDDLDDLLVDADAGACAAECHGFLCGQICISGFPDDRQVHDYLAIEDEEAPKARKCLDEIRSLSSEIRALITSPHFDFQLLLPDDNAPLRERIAALADWCHGFLNGFGMSKDVQSASLDEECRELIEDFTRICRIGLDSEADEGDEQALTELVEYVRIGTLSLFETLQPSQADPDKPEVLH